MKRMKAAERNALLAAIVESSDDAIISKSLDGTIRSWNNAAERMFGYTAAEAIGRNITLIIPADRLSEEIGILAQIRSGQKIDHFVTVRQAKDGSLLNISLTVSPIRDASGAIIGASKVARDITGRLSAEREREEKARLLESEMTIRRGIEEELTQKVADLVEADQRKDEFLAMLGHELRNPLSAVSNSIAVACFDEEHRERALDIARRETAQLTRLVDDLLDVARITKGRIALSKGPANLANLIERALEETRAMAESHHAQLLVSIAPENHSLMVEADPARLQQVFSNLIHNAIKFSPSGGRIELELLRRSAEAVVRIRDWGIGITPEVLPRVFDLFTQGNVSLNRAHGGLGIGLTLVRQLIEMHGGRVEARSEGLGKGSEFQVFLPIVNVEEQNDANDCQRRESHGARVLIVEDNLDAADSLAMLLEMFGHQASVVRSGFAALEAVRADSFDAVLIDIGLPGIDGYEVARRIRTIPNLNAGKLIALTGYGQDSDRKRALTAGFDKHMVKPVNVEQLERILKEASSPKRALSAGQ